MKRATEMSIVSAKYNSIRNTAPAGLSLAHLPTPLINLISCFSKKTNLFQQQVRKHLGKLLQQSYAIASDFVISFVSIGGQVLSARTYPATYPSFLWSTTLQVVSSSSAVQF